MNKNAEIFLSKTLGTDFLESVGISLCKSEVFKPGTRSVTDTDDLFQGLQIVPKALLGLLVRELSPMQIGDTKEIKIPVKEDTVVVVTKHERDSFSGQVLQNNVKINEFLQRSIPGLGLVLMTVLELYDVDNIPEIPSKSKIDEKEINRIIDERLDLHSLVNKVVDGKMMQRDAVQQLLISKLNQMSEEHEKVVEEKKEKEPTVIVLTPKKKLPLVDFVENRKKKFEKKEHFVNICKGETVDCPDCGNTIFNDTGFSACICFGDSGKVHLKKTEKGVKISFGKKWDIENIELLLQILRGNKNENL